MSSDFENQNIPEFNNFKILSNYITLLMIKNDNIEALKEFHKKCIQSNKVKISDLRKYQENIEQKNLILDVIETNCIKKINKFEKLLVCANENQYINLELYACCRYNKFKIFKYLIDNNIAENMSLNINTIGDTFCDCDPINHAIENNSLEIVKYMYENNMCKTYCKYTNIIEKGNIWVAIKNRNKELTKYMWDSGFNFTLLHNKYAPEDQEKDKIDFLVSVVGIEGLTIFLKAAMNFLP